MNQNALAAGRESVAMFSLAGRAHIAVRGADRAKFLHNFCTNDVLGLQPGQGCEAFFCNAKGRVLAYATLFAMADAIWIDSEAGSAESLMAHLDRYIIREDVTLEDHTAELTELAFVGPQAGSALSQIVAVPDLDALACPGIRELGEHQVRCVSWLRERTYLLTVPAELVESSLAAWPGPRGDAANWDSLRITAGFPKYGVDITADNLPQEIALNDRCISFRKGCYLGQEPVARLDALGHTNRELRRLRINAETIPTDGTPLTDPVTGQSVGEITSAAKNSDGTGIVAIGYLKTKWNAVGTVVSWGTPPQSATVGVP